MGVHVHVNVYIHILFLACALSGYIFVNLFTCITYYYQSQQYIIMEPETETSKKIARTCIEILIVECVTCYIFVKFYLY